jgi:branched-chain amino acid transport system ATP-binding protein
MAAEAQRTKDQPALECTELTKRFGGLEAVRNVTLRVEKGERRALIGPNGAGKTTLFSLISGIYPVTSGQVKVFGQEITDLPPYRRAAMGLGRTFQITSLFSSMTVAENLVIAAMGLERTKFGMLLPLTRQQRYYREATAVLERLGIADKANETVRNLSHGEQRQVEIAMALVTSPSVLLLDEPAAGLSPAESAGMVRLIKDLDRSITVLLIEHDMDVALDIASKISVLHQGALFTEGDARQIKANPEVQAIYFGSEEDDSGGER